jgi:hypothetical protein
LALWHTVKFGQKKVLPGSMANGEDAAEHDIPGGCQLIVNSAMVKNFLISLTWLY